MVNFNLIDQEYDCQVTIWPKMSLIETKAYFLFWDKPYYTKKRKLKKGGWIFGELCIAKQYNLLLQTNR